MNPKIVFILLLGMIILMPVKANNDAAFYMQRLSARDIDNESKLQCIDSLLCLDVPERDSLQFLKLELSVATGKYHTAISTVRQLREADRKFPVDMECNILYKYIRALTTAQQFEESMQECIKLLKLNKPDSLIYYDAYANAMLDEYTRHMRVGLEVDYIAENARLLQYAIDRQLPDMVISRVARSLHNQKMLEAIYSVDFDKALREATSLMKLPATELEQAHLDTNIAYIYMMIGKPELAEKYYRQLLTAADVLYPHGVALMNYMHLLNQQGRYQESLDVYNRHSKASNVFKNDLYYTYLLSNKAEAEYHSGLQKEAFSDMMTVKILTDSLYLQAKAYNGLLGHKLRKKEAELDNILPKINTLSALAWGFGIAFIGSAAAFIFISIKLKAKESNLREVSDKLKDVTSLHEECLRQRETKIQTDNGKIAANMLQLAAIQESISSIESALSNRRKSPEEKLDIISNAIKSALNNTSARDLFEQQFEQAHAPFFKKLYAAHPDLSPGETRVCAYLIMNLTSKEIAAITNKTLRAVESTRYRLCRKFNLPEGQSAITYLRQFIR